MLLVVLRLNFGLYVLICLVLSIALNSFFNAAQGWSFLNKNNNLRNFIHHRHHHNLWNRRDALLSSFLVTSTTVIIPVPTDTSSTFKSDRSIDTVITASEEPDVHAAPRVAEEVGVLSEEEVQNRQEEVRRRRLLERRQLMEASRSSNNRQSYLDLSRQRAVLYNTKSKAVSCPPNIPCL